jgi:peptide/nickel transport system permease protein
VLSELQTDYVRGLAAVGASRTRIVTREVLPNALPTLLAQGTLNAATAIMLEASLSFVGLGVQPPSASWGTLLQQGYTQLFQAAWYPVFPAMVIILAIAPLNVLSGQLQRVLYRGRP